MLYDKALVKFPEVRDAVVFDIENVSRMFFDSDQQYWDLAGNDFPNIAPVYSKCWFEYVIINQNLADTKYLLIFSPTR